MARIIKGAGHASVIESERTSRSRIIDGETFDAQVRAKSLLNEGERERLAKIDLGQAKAQRAENQACQAAIEAIQNECLLGLVRLFIDYETLFHKGERGIRVLSQEMVKKILGEGIEISQTRYDSALARLRVPMKKLTIEMSTTQVGDLTLLPLPFWMEVKESQRVEPGRILIETDAGVIECSSDSLTTALNLSIENA